MVYYRKYRSQTIDELDNAEIRTTLLSVLSKPESIPHAFLFTGPKGLGKTSTARIIAKVVNCQRLASSELASGKTEKNLTAKRYPLNANIEPCNECEQCITITNGTNMDVLEIDAASNRGIDEIRDLKEKIRLTPLSAKKKVYIIDEVHMLTTEAFNALLKTLEEPPIHSMFILCTTEPHKVPSTILSRCFHISFHLASPDELIRSFKRIAKGEKIDIEDEALQLIAKLSEGGFRDGTKILEEVVSLSAGKKITKELIEEKYKVSSSKSLVLNLLDSLIIKDIKGGLQIIRNAMDMGIDTKYFIQQLMEVLHELLLEQVGIQNKESNFDNSPLKNHQKLNIDRIRRLVDIFSKAYIDMKYSVLPQLPLELAVVEWCGSSENKNLGNNNEAVQKSEDKDPAAVSTEVTVTSLRKQVGTITKIKALYGEPSPTSTPPKQTIETTTIDLMHVPSNGQIPKEWQDTLWKSIISEMKLHNHTIAGVLRGCIIKSYDEQQLIIEAAYKFHKERLDEMKTREALKNVCKMLTGKEIKIEVKLKG